MIFFIGFVVNTIYHSLESDILLQELGVALLILVLNKCLNLLIRKIISLNKHKTKPKEEFFAIKMVFPFILANIFGYELLEYAEAIFHGVLDKTER